jgi:hypothetical protein
MSDTPEQPGGAATQAAPSEEDRSEIGQRAAYEAELNRITSSEMILQTTVSLLNIGGRRLGLAPPASPGDPAAAAAGAERDLEQVRDAIDGASALLPILERRMPRELGPLRDAIAQLQVAYAREAQSHAASSAASPPAASQASPASGGQPKPADEESPATPTDDAESEQQGPGPAQASGRLWVPGR